MKTFYRLELIVSKEFCLNNPLPLFNVSCINTDSRPHYSFASKRSSRKKKHRAGYRVALRRLKSYQLTIPAILSLNARSILNKVDDLNSLIQCKFHENTSVIMVQETWLNPFVDTNLVNLNNFKCFRCDKLSDVKNVARAY